MTKFADSKESPQIHLKLGDEIRKSVGGIGSFKNFSYLCEKIRNMSENQDIRWVQRLSNYDKAVARLQNAARIVSTEKQFSGEVDDLLKEGLVQRFEYTQELAWKVMKDYEEYQGVYRCAGFEGCYPQGFANGYCRGFCLDEYHFIP